jgi:hypothetical protein
MRRILIATAASGLLLGGIPATALARHHSQHKRHHHAKVERFGSDSTQSGTTQSPSSTANPPTVASFTGGVLMIDLHNGSTVSGQVTPDTEIECSAAQDQATSHDDGKDNGGGDNGGDRGDENAGQACDSSVLTPGTTVREAELRVSSAGAVWAKVEVVSSSTTAPNATNSDNDDNNDG